MKKFKRNAVIITVLVFVCMAVYLNWSYGKEQTSDVDANISDESEESSELYYNADEVLSAQTEDSNDDYFASAKLTREQARDSALTLLQEAADAEEASQEVIDEAVSAMTTMAEYAEREASIENMLIAKGFDKCVVYFTDTGVSVAVPAPAEGLSSSEVAQITDILTTESDVEVDQIKIIEVK